MANAKTVTRALARVALALVLAVGFMPIAMGAGVSSQAHAVQPMEATPITEAYVEPIVPQTYTGEQITPKPKVMYGGKTLVEGTDYTLEYGRNLGEGTAHVYVNGIGAYTGRKIVTFDIIQAQITSISLSETRYFYDGKRKTPVVTVKCGDKVLENGQDYIVVGMQNQDLSSVGVHTLTVKGTANYAGVLTADFEILAPLEDEDSGIKSPANDDSKPTDPEDEGQLMYRLYNPNSGEHFYTLSTVERDNLISVGWNDEGTGWKAPSSGDAVYRLYNSYAGEHHYTLSTVERDSLVAAGWSDEGIGWYSDTAYSVPLYRLYNPNEYANNHHYTTSEVERDFLLNEGWDNEGISWYGLE